VGLGCGEECTLLGPEETGPWCWFPVSPVVRPCGGAVGGVGAGAEWVVSVGLMPSLRGVLS
jgi:hypothetical protein